MMKLILMIAEIVTKVKKDKVNMYSAQSSFFIIVSFFPFIMLLLCILNYTNITESLLLTLVYDLLPSKTQPLIISIINEIYHSSSFTLLSVTAVSAIWAAGKGFVSIIQGLNDVYDTGGESRNYFVLRFHAMLYTIALIVIIIFSLVLMVFGNRLLDLINVHWPLVGSAIQFILRFRFLIFIGVLTLFSLVLYIVVPNRKSKIRHELPGAVFTALGWSIFSYVFSIYVDMSKGFAVTYGSLATLVFIMLWLYACMNVLFIGAEINAHFQGIV
jgi:membrane protein